MKRLLSAFVLVTICATAFAQVSVTSANYYRIGNTVRDIYVVANDLTDSVATTSIVNNPFVLDNSLRSLFEAYNMIDTAFYDEPRTEGEFTNASFSYADENGMRMHITVTDEKAFCLGISGALAQMGLNDDMELKFEEPMDVIEFPAVLNSAKSSTAHGSYLKHIREMQSAFNSMDGGAMVYEFVTAEYDSILIDMQVTYNSTFDEAGTLTLSGDFMQQGEYEYLRENRQYAYVTNMYLHRIDGEFLNINECTLTNPFFAAYFGTATINLGEAMNALMGMHFPISSTTTTLNYWTANDNYPILEMSTNANATGVKKLAVRYGENGVCVENQKISANIYPNPTSDFLNIEMEEMGEATIRIYSVNGSLVKEDVLNGSHNSINVNTFSNGNYFYTISCGDKEISGKFAKN
ncbi:MAG: T9SS type A sorting domain-containing protein [Bacteroidales bacterium]|nr:T9SS type A sorting domain-containing protein [Bacteroidales bacterium]